METETPVKEAPPEAAPASLPNDPMLSPRQAPPEPAEPQAEAAPEPAEKPPTSAPVKTVVQQKTSKPKDKNVTTAIVATVIIILGLAILAVYAYTSSH